MRVGCRLPGRRDEQVDGHRTVKAMIPFARSIDSLPKEAELGITRFMVLQLICTRSGRMASAFLSSLVKLRSIGVTLAAVALSGCASLPTNAPTANQVVTGVHSKANTIPYKVVDIDAAVATNAGADSAVDMTQLAELSNDPVPPRADMIRKGDTLSISIFEVGVSLFAGQQALGADPAPTPSASAHQVTLHVLENGELELPYIGAFHAEGSYPEQLAQIIAERLRRFSESPQVLVTIADSVENAVYVGGTVARSGRYRLTTARERLLDMLTLAGGPSINVNDSEIRLVRGNRIATLPLSELRAEDPTNLQLQAGDRIHISRRSKTYTVFGATDRVSQQPFETRTVTLAEALARVAGPSDSRANARGVFLFRLQKGENGAPPQAIVYRLNMMRPDSYFLAQMFQIQDKDVVLFANSSSNLTAKFIAMLNQLFSPAITAKIMTQ